MTKLVDYFINFHPPAGDIHFAAPVGYQIDPVQKLVFINDVAISVLYLNRLAFIKLQTKEINNRVRIDAPGDIAQPHDCIAGEFLLD